MALNIANIPNEIAKMSVSGVTIKDIDQIPEFVTGRNCPILFPRPEEFLTGITFTPDSYGVGSSRKWSVRYTLNYIYLHAPVGSMRGLANVYSGFYTKIGLILDAIIAYQTVTEAIDIAPQNAFNITVIEDGKGNQFYGAFMAFNVLEYVN